jgi:hypothetical protein
MASSTMIIHVNGGSEFGLSYGTQLFHEVQFVAYTVQTYYNIQNLYVMSNKNIIPV